ncbi:MAG: 3',5'-cyclic-nucleotide phosphodiesterase [Fuerstiella sp.]
MSDDRLKVELIPSTVSEAAARQFCIAALVNDSVAIDAGSLGMLWPMQRQEAVRHVFLSHSHMDHIASLPLFLDNVYKPNQRCPVIHASSITEECLRQDVFNDRIWPDFFRLSEDESPFLKMQTLSSEEAVILPDLTVTPVSVNHVVPTMAFVVQNKTAAVAFVSDTHCTDRVWTVLRQFKNLQAVYVECSFPNSHAWLAQKSGHLCPDLLAPEIGRLPDHVQVIACHLKPAFFDQITKELSQLQLPNLEIGQPGKVYTF